MRTEKERVVVPVIAEQPRIEKRAIERGGVRVSKRVEEHVEHVDVPLIREDVDVERRAVNRVVDERPEARIEDGITVVPVFEEIVQRRFLVREEVRVGRRRTEGRAVADIPVNREQVAIERIDPGTPRADGAVDVRGTEEAAFVSAEPRVVDDVVLERTAHERIVPVKGTLQHTEVNVAGTGRSEMNPSYQTPTPSSPSANKVAVVEKDRGVTSKASGAARATASRARSFPVGVLLLLVVLAIALIALIAAIF